MLTRTDLARMRFTHGACDVSFLYKTNKMTNLVLTNDFSTGRVDVYMDGDMVQTVVQPGCTKSPMYSQIEKLAMGAKSWYISPFSQPDYFNDSTAISLGTTQNFLFNSNGGFTLLLKTKDGGMGSAEYGTYFQLYVDNVIRISVTKISDMDVMVSMHNLIRDKYCYFDTDARAWSVAQQSHSLRRCY